MKSSHSPYLRVYGSTQILTVIKNASAPTSFAYPVEISEGGALAQNADGSVNVNDAAGNQIGYVAAPWAKDASGKNVPTHFVVTPNSITQVVETSASTAYPVVADPNWWQNTLSAAVAGFVGGLVWGITKLPMWGTLAGGCAYGAMTTMWDRGGFWRALGNCLWTAALSYLTGFLTWKVGSFLLSRGIRPR